MIQEHMIFQLTECKNNVLAFTCKNISMTVRIFVLEDDIIRVLFSEETLKLSRTWLVAPGMEDIPKEGRDRLDIMPFSRPKFSYTIDNGICTIITAKLKAEFRLDGMKAAWYYRSATGELLFARDRKTQAYNFNHELGTGVFHYMECNPQDRYYGLGEKAGNLERSGKAYKMMSMDPMGYDAETTDPLYKHFPFYITRNQSTGISFGIFYDNLSTSVFDMGQQIDNYHGLYRYYQAEDGDLDYYIILGPGISDVTPRFSWLTGKTLFMPKWSIGYSGSTMIYTDADNAQEQLQKFVLECSEHNIPCNSFQLSSGYTSIGDKRYVFNWNRKKTPDPAALARYFHEHGIRLCANIKPALLKDHPQFKDMDRKKLFVKTRDGKQTEIAQFWDDLGAYIDFTNTEAYNWWKTQVTEQLLSYGIDSTWNDNNEYEIWDNEATANGFGTPINIGQIRPLQSLLMMKASYEAQKSYVPENRPYLISRSGCPGMQRYVQTWSGDNRTAYKTLKYNIRMGIGLSLSGIYNIGHDVGGFAGEAPDPELLVRWVQNGMFHPRFTIHSWNDDKTVNVPWMYPEYTSLIRNAMYFRVTLTPLFYNLLYRAHTYYEPIIRPTFYNFEDDPATFVECDDFMLGSDLLVASVVQPGQFERNVYLPKTETGWFDYHTGLWYKGGQTVKLPSPIQYCPLLVKGGAIIPVNDAEVTFETKENDKRGFLLYPPVTGSGQNSCELFEDDGMTEKYRTGCYTLVHVTMSWNKEEISIQVSAAGAYTLPYTAIKLHLPETDSRKIILNGKKATHADLRSVPINTATKQ